LQRLNGSYRVDAVFAVDTAKRVAYAYGAFPSRRDRALLAFPIAGGPPQNLTPASGTHVVWLAPSNGLFVDTHSTLIDPPQTELVSVAGRRQAVLVPRSETLRAQLLPVRTLTVNSSYGPLDATMILPDNFDSSRRYPVVIYTYGGPEAPVTQNAFGYARGLYHQLLARSGIIVFSIDGPGSQIDNAAHVRLMYHALGQASLAGQESGVAYLRSLPFVDPLRIGIWGWSFGGYEAVYALTHSTDFKAAAAGAPVTDWRYYDSIYTERYMGPPQNNATSYDQNSAVNAAAALHGDLLISHGTADDNVHFANSIAFVRSLISADRLRVDVVPYPGQKHHFTALEDLRGLYAHMLEWWTTHL
jgi:dipeptidyl-peptidase-4